MPVLSVGTAAAGAVFHEEPPDVGDILSLCSAKAGFPARRHLYKVRIVANQACGFNPFVLSHPSMKLCVSGVPVDDACDQWVSNAR